MAFDVAGAKAAGYSDAEIQQFLLAMPETAEAKKAGYSDAEILSHFGLSAPAPKEDGLTARRAAEVSLGAAAPTALGALGGVAVGGASIPAALGGAALLGGAELVGNLYNVARGAAGYQPVKTPFEYIRGALPERLQPQTPEERLLATGVEGGLGAATGAGAARSAVNAMTAAGRQAPRILNVLAAQPAAQTVAGAAAPVAGEVAKEAGADPYTQFGASILGGAAAGRSVGALAKTGRAASAIFNNLGTPTTAQLENSAEQAFKTSKAAGLTYDRGRLSDFVDRTKNFLRSEDYDPDTDTLVTTALNRLSEKADKGAPSLSDLHDVRKFIGKRLRTNPDSNTRRFGGMLTNELDDFVTDLDNATTVSKSVMDAPGVTQTFRNAIDQYRMMSQSSEIEHAIERAAKKRDFGSAIQTQMGRIADNERRLRRFTPEQQEAIRAMAEGQFAPGAISGLSKFAPSFTVPGMLKGAIGGGAATAGAMMGMPAIPIAMGALGAGGLAASGARNLLARGMAGNLAASMRGGQLIAPTPYPNQALGLPVFAQGLNAMARQ